MPRRSRRIEREESTAVRPKRRRRRRRPFLAGLLLLLVGGALLAGFAPWIVARSPVLHYALDRAAADLQIQIRCGSASLHWIRPPELRDVQIVDAKQQKLLELSRLTLDRPLWNLLQDPTNLGRIELYRPVLHVGCRRGGSNIEDVLQRLPSPQENAAPWHGEILIHEGTLILSDELHGQTWSLAGWQARVTLPVAGQTPLQLESAWTTPHEATTSRLVVQGQIAVNSGSPQSLSDLDLQVQMQQCPAGLIQVATTRLAYDVSLDGLLDGQLHGVWHPTNTAAPAQLTGTLSVSHLLAQSPAWHDDRLNLEQAVASWDLSSQGSLLDVRQLQISSELGQVQLVGQFDQRSLPALLAAPTTVVPTHPWHLSGNVDLARLAHMAPRTLHLRDDTRLTSGQVRGDLVCQADGSSASWQGNLETSQLQAERGGQPLGIQDPVQLTFRATQTPQGLQVEDLAAQSTFLSLRGAGQAASGQVAWRADLSRLHSELGQLVDWRNVNLAGQVEGQLQWQATAENDVQTRGHMSGSNVRVLYGNRVDLRESEIELDFTSQGRLQQHRLSELASAHLQFQASGDQLLVDLTGPVADPLATHRWPMQLRCTGQLASWRQRLQTLTASPLPQVAGWLDMSLNVLADPTVFDVTSAEVTLKDLHLGVLKPDGQYLWSEPIVRARASGRYDVPRAQIDLTSLDVRTDAIALQVAGAVHNVTQECELRLTGQIQYDLQRLSSRMQPLWGDQVQLTGQGARPFTVAGPCRQPTESAIRVASLPGTPDLPWIPPGLTAQASLGWDSIQAWGFNIGAGSLETHLQQQHLTFEPLTLPVSGGQVHLATRVRLGANPVVELDRGLLAERVQMTPEMCQGWLKYVAPLLADTTRAEGLFSVELDGLRLPLLHPKAASAAGTLAIHTARAGPGPITQKLWGLGRQIQSVMDPGRAGSANLEPIATWMSLPEQRVAFRLERGQVWHENLTMLVGNIPIRTSGWVGLNQRLALNAQVPLQQKWLGGNRLLSSMQDQPINIPIQGTMQQPQLSVGALDDLGRQAVGGAAQGLIQQELEKQLERLFPQ